MNDKAKSSADNRKILVLAGIVAAIVLAGGYFYSQQHQSKTASVSIGGKTFSATISE